MIPDLSRGSFFPLLLIRSTAFAPPPNLAVASLASKSATSASMAFDFSVNSGEDVEMRDGRTEAWYERHILRTLGLSDRLSGILRNMTGIIC